MATYTAIKRDSTFPITVGGNTLINLQKLLLFILADKSEEEIQTAHDKILKQEYDEDWYEHVAFLSLMINIIEKTAHEKGLTIQENLDEQDSSTKQ
jgi:hypothetical protein